MNNFYQSLFVAIVLATTPWSVPAQEVIVDNGGPGFSVVSGSWGPSANAGFFGTNSLVVFVGGSQEARVRWRPTLPNPGIYTVDAWWVASGNRPEDVTYEVVGANGNSPVVVDQRSNSSRWNRLGEFAFSADGNEFVDLTDNVTTGDFVSADAVRFTYLRDTVPSPCPVVATEILPVTGGGCGGCGGSLLPGSVEPVPTSGVKWAMHSDLPEKFSTPGVLYTTKPVIPEDDSANPLPLSIRTQTNNGFTAIDDDFEVFMFHISTPGDGSAPRRIVTWVENLGTEPVLVNDPRQAIVTQGVIGDIHEMESTLGQRVLSEDWDRPVSTFTLQPGQGRAVAYSNGFSGFGPGIDANVNCFGIVRTGIDKVSINDPDPQVAVSIVAIPFGATNAINSTTPTYLNVAALSDEDVVDMTQRPTGCQLSRATGVFPNFRWRSDDDIVLDASRLPLSGYQFQMAASKVQAIACPQQAQTEDLILHPGYAPTDTVGNYMVEYRVDFTLSNPDTNNVRLVDVTFGKNNADVGLGFQKLVGNSLPSDEELAAQPADSLWAGPRQSSLTKSLFPEGAIRLNPCESKVVSIRFMVLGNASLPFQLNVEPAGVEEIEVIDGMILR